MPRPLEFYTPNRRDEKPFSVPLVLASIFTALAMLFGGRGMPRPYRATPGVRLAPHPALQGHLGEA